LIEFRFRIPPGKTADQVESAVRAVAVGEKLDLGQVRSLKTVPGSSHWHITKRPENGTVEVTFDPLGSEIRVSVHANRHGSWAGATLESFAAKLNSKLKNI
jgi:hypothetical protein